MSRRADRWKTVCESWIRRVDPQFHDPIYWLLPREVKGIFSQTGYAGLTGCGMAGDLRERIEHRGEWHGLGFCAIIDVQNITTTGNLLATATHEYAHYVVNAPILSALAAMMRAEKVVESLSTPKESVSRGDVPEPVSTDRNILASQHGPAFIRVCLHLDYRAIRLGQWLSIVDAPGYGWPACWLWKRALGNEPDRLASLPMVAVAAMPPPETFRLFSEEATK